MLLYSYSPLGKKCNFEARRGWVPSICDLITVFLSSARYSCKSCIVFCQYAKETSVRDEGLKGKSRKGGWQCELPAGPQVWVGSREQRHGALHMQCCAGELQRTTVHQHSSAEDLAEFAAWEREFLSNMLFYAPERKATCWNIEAERDEGPETVLSPGFWSSVSCMEEAGQ